jgi:hypothetical protein
VVDNAFLEIRYPQSANHQTHHADARGIGFERKRIVSKPDKKP